MLPPFARRHATAIKPLGEEVARAWAVKPRPLGPEHRSIVAPL